MLPIEGGWPAWYDPDDERTCRAVWSRIAEPGDDHAYRRVARLGPGRALRTVVEPGCLDGDAAYRAVIAEEIRATVGPYRDPVGRWRVRLPDVDPRRDALTASRVAARFLVPGDPEWPERLADLGDGQPFCLWVRGQADLAQRCASSVSIVGARACSGYGEVTTRELAAGCVGHGLTVVSGAAYGIDAVAHRAALSLGGGTVAVLACGIDRAYPRGNESLIEAIADAGCVVTEIPPGASPTRWRFLERNRIIAAISRGTVVVEAAWRSGAAGTAGRALDLGRPVGAVPGPVTASTSAGCHRLLRSGATCVTDADEILELVSPIGTVDLPDRTGPTADHDGLDPAQVRVLDALPLRRGVPLARVARTAGLEDRDVIAVLGRLELLGLAEQTDGGWRRARRAPEPTRPLRRR